MRNVGLFGTCRVSSLKGEGLSVVRKTKSNTTASKVGLVYQDACAIYEGQPFNYTTKLRDVIDSIRYLKGELLGGAISANREKTFFSLFCRGYASVCFERRECSEPGSWKDYHLIVAEVSSLRQIVIKTDRFGKIYRGINLPWNILLEPQHQLMNLTLEDFEVIEPSQETVDNMLGELLDLIGCPLLIIGPYLLPRTPESRTLFGDDDNIPLDKINTRRNEVRSMLIKSQFKDSFSYFDMSEYIASSPELLVNQYHFSDRGNEILYEVIKSKLLAGDR